jgi:hypothetical protein
MLSKTQTTYGWMGGLIMNDGVEESKREQRWPSFRYYLDIWHEGLKEVTKIVILKIRCPDKESNMGYEAV